MTWLNNTLKLGVGLLAINGDTSWGLKTNRPSCYFPNWVQLAVLSEASHLGVCQMSPIDSVFTPLIPITAGTTLEPSLGVVITCCEREAEKTGLRGGTIQWQRFKITGTSLQWRLFFFFLHRTLMQTSLVFFLWLQALCLADTAKLATTCQKLPPTALPSIKNIYVVNFCSHKSDEI